MKSIDFMSPRGALAILQSCVQGTSPCQIIPCGPHARGRRARCRNRLKTNGFPTTSTSDFNKAYENTILSHRRTSEISARAHVLNLKKPMVFQHLCYMSSRELLSLSSNGLRAPARGHNPLQKIPCGPHARVVASSSSAAGP